MVGKKKRGHPDVEEVLARPWCYYCERDFDDLKILISHQKAKHFKCERCGRRLNTAGGLSVHMNQVHKETLTTVENALGNRAGLEVEIFGMEGIPEDIAQAHNQRIITQFYQAEAERRAASGNNGANGQAGGNAQKKAKFESPAELKKRLAEHKARLAEQAAGDSSGGNTPGPGPGPGNAQSPALDNSPASFQNNSPFPPPTAPFGGAPPGASFGSYPQEAYPPAAPAYPPYGAQAAYSPPGRPEAVPHFPSQFPSHFPPQNNFQQPPFTAPTPYGPPSVPYSQFQGPPAHTPPPGMLPNRPPGLPQLPLAPGLPQRPAFGGAPMPPQARQGGYLHSGTSGGWSGNGWNSAPQNPAMSTAYPPQNSAPIGDDIDELIRMAEAGIKPVKKPESLPPLDLNNPPPSLPAQVHSLATISQSVPTTTDSSTAPEVAEKPEKKSSKKDKDKGMKLVYSDNEISPEEKMAKMSRYAFVPNDLDADATGDTSTASEIAGTV